MRKTYQTQRILLRFFSGLCVGIVLLGFVVSLLSFLSPDDVFAAPKPKKCPNALRGDVGPTDLDGDCRVGATDLTVILSHWNQSGNGDINTDNRVNVFDLGILLSRWTG